MINFNINITPRCGLAFDFMMQQITGAAHRNIGCTKTTILLDYHSDDYFSVSLMTL
jgi:hypothetical protein